LAFIGVFSSHGKKGSSKQLLSHYYFIDLILGLDYPCRKGGSDMAKKKSRSISRQIAWKFMQGCVGLVGLTFSVLSTCHVVEVPEFFFLLSKVDLI
jgi:hypothetical protein